MRRTIIMLAVLLLALPARAQDAFTDALAGLAGGFGAQAEAAERLGALGDPRAIVVLRALSDNRLRKRTDGTLLIQDGAVATLAATGETADTTGTEPVRINNRVRVAIRGALGRLQLVSPDPTERLAAAEAVFRAWKPRWRARACRAFANAWNWRSAPRASPAAMPRHGAPA